MRHFIDSHAAVSGLGWTFLALQSFLFESLSHFLSVQFSGFFKVGESILTPAGPAEGTGYILATGLLVLDPPLHTLCVQIAAAAELAIGQILILVHDIVTDAAVLTRIQRALFYPLLGRSLG